MGVKSIKDVTGIEKLNGDDLLVVETEEGTRSINYNALLNLIGGADGVTESSFLNPIEVDSEETSFPSEPGFYIIPKDISISYGDEISECPEDFRNLDFYYIKIVSSKILEENEEKTVTRKLTTGIAFRRSNIHMYVDTDIITKYTTSDSSTVGSSTSKKYWTSLKSDILIDTFRNSMMLDEYEEPILDEETGEYVYTASYGYTTYATKETKAKNISSISTLNKINDPGVWWVDLSSLSDSVLKNLGECILTVYRQDTEDCNAKTRKVLHGNDKTGVGTPRMFINDGKLTDGTWSYSAWKEIG